MKKSIKIILITLAAILGLLIIAVCILLFVILTPSKITPIVNEQVAKYVNCDVNIEKIDLTLFHDFPKISIQLSDVKVINPMQNSQNDTLAKVENIYLSVNIREFLKNKSLIINDCLLENATVNVFSDENGIDNYDIFIGNSSPDSDTTQSAMPFNSINLKKVCFKNLNVSYIDLSTNLDALVKNLNLDIKGSMKDDAIDCDLTLKSDFVSCKMLTDSVIPQEIINASTEGFSIFFNGNIKDFNDIKGDVAVGILDACLGVQSVEYLNNQKLDFKVTAFSFNGENANFEDADFTLDDYSINLAGEASISDDIFVNCDFATNHWVLEELMKILPSTILKIIDDAGVKKVEGGIILSGNVNGVYSNDSVGSMPVISVDVKYDNGFVNYSGLPFVLSDIETDLHADLDFGKNSVVNIKYFDANTPKSKINIAGEVEDVFNKLFCNLKLNADINLQEFQVFLPDDMNAEMRGIAGISANVKGTLDQITNVELSKLKLNGDVDFRDLFVTYNDSICAQTAAMKIKLEVPSKADYQLFKEALTADISSGKLNINIADVQKIDLDGVKLNLATSDFITQSDNIAIACNFDVSKLVADIDTISVNIYHPDGVFSMYPQDGKMIYECTYNSDSINAVVGEEYRAAISLINLVANSQYDEKQKNMLLQWNPDVNFNFNNAVIHVAGIDYPVEVPKIRFDFVPGKFYIEESKFVVGNTDFQLSGTLHNLDKFVKKTGLLEGEMDFISDHADVNQIMEIMTSLAGHDTSNVVVSQDTVKKEDNPLMIPAGIDFTLNTLVNQAVVGESYINDLGGTITLKDGTLIMEELGFTSKAARMQLTAMYRPERKNHLFTGIDFHLLDIEIKDLIDMIPDIDTLVPMLKSFDGKAEFHLAVETYLKSNYDIKFSTLRGAAAIEGQDLVVLDSETFDKISKLLMFNKKTENKIDSISVEMTVFRNEIDLYPFLIVMDKYKAVVSGRHNLDMSCNYHISLTDCPLPVRLGVNIEGNIQHPHIELAPCRYANLYRPEKRNAVLTKQLELKKMIGDALKANVKD